MATLFVDKVDPQSGTSLEIGSSGDTITIPSGATITNNGTATNFGKDNTPAFLATPSATQTISNTTFTKILFQTEVLDTDSAYDASASTFTVPSGKGGVYIFYCNMRMPLSDGEERTHLININGSNDSKSGVQFYPGNNAPFYSTATQMLNLSAGDVIYQNVYVTSSGTRTTNTDYTYFGGYKLGT
jgi:hypothetical protein